MRDIELDWRRWGVVERIIAIAIVLCSVMGPPSVFVVDLVAGHEARSNAPSSEPAAAAYQSSRYASAAAL